MRTLVMLCLAAACLSASPIAAQTGLPSGCRNNDRSACAFRMELDSLVEGLIDGSGNARNYFLVEITRPGVYELYTTRESHPLGSTANVKLDVVDSDGNSLLDQYLHYDDSDQHRELIEFSTAGSYLITYNYNTGNFPVGFTLTLRPRARA